MCFKIVSNLRYKLSEIEELDYIKWIGLNELLKQSTYFSVSDSIHS